MVSTPISTPIPSTGTPAAARTGVIVMMAPAGMPGIVNDVAMTVSTIVAS